MKQRERIDGSYFRDTIFCIISTNLSVKNFKKLSHTAVDALKQTALKTEFKTVKSILG